MKRSLPLFFVLALVTVISCSKEYSLENGGNLNNPLVIGADCRISKISYLDSASGVGKGSLTATINPLDQTVDITKFDSLSATIDFNSALAYFGDTIYINPDEYFLIDVVSKHVRGFHGLVDPTVPGSLQFDADYIYDVNNYLVQKSYSLTTFPGIPYFIVNYTYSGGNLVHMESMELSTGDLVTDADINYYSNISPKAFLYIFPDELAYANFNQFLDFGKRPLNAVKDMKVRYYDPGNVLRDSSVSTFKNYIMSRDNYVMSVLMRGNDQFSIPADSSKLVFSYHCK
jgi:hypothetical protein